MVKGTKISDKLVRCSNIIFTSEIFTNISLINNNYLCGIQISTLDSRFHAHAESKRNICYTEDNNTNIGWCVFGDTCKMALKHVVTIKIGLLTIGLHPHFVAAILGQIIQAGDTKSELARFTKFTENDASREQLVAANMSSHLEHILVDVVHAVTMQTEYELTFVTLK